MNTKGLLVCLEFYVELQSLKKLGLTQEEIDGFFEFEWDVGKDLFLPLLERSLYDRH